MDKIVHLKKQFRAAVLEYRALLPSHLDCGASMRAVISPRLGMAAARANELGAQLKAIDPSFPKSWTPYATGDR